LEKGMNRPVDSAAPTAPAAPVVKPVTVARAVIETLRDLGVRHVFGVPSGGWVDYMEALRQTEGIEFVLASHEGGAAFMAAVTGHLTGVPGVCFGTFGPGATNLATGVGCALLDRWPMIALTDEMPAAMRGRTTQMGIDHQALFAPLTKATTRLDAACARQVVAEAAALAMAERPGPVHIGLPVGLSAETTTAPAPVLRPEPSPVPDRERLATARTAIAGSRRPLLALGPAAARAGLGAAITALAERLQAPMVITPMAKGLIDEGHPLYAGVLFHALGDVVAQTYQQADLVIGIGYDPVEFNYESWMPAVPLVHFDTVPLDIDRGDYPAASAIVGALSTSVEALLALEPQPSEWDLTALAARRAEMQVRMASAVGAFGPCAVLELLREHLPADAIMACDVGAHTHLIGQKWPTPAWQCQIMTNGWSSMGFGIPAAIAAKLARPAVPVCAVVGDGGLLMTAGELAVAVREQLDVLVVVLTDNDLALIRIKQERKHNPIYGTPVRNAGAIGSDTLFGAPVFSAGDGESFRAALARAALLRGPVIVEARIDSREYDALVLRTPPR